MYFKYLILFSIYLLSIRRTADAESTTTYNLISVNSSRSIQSNVLEIDQLNDKQGDIRRNPTNRRRTKRKKNRHNSTTVSRKLMKQLLDSGVNGSIELVPIREHRTIKEKNEKKKKSKKNVINIPAISISEYNNNMTAIQVELATEKESLIAANITRKSNRRKKGKKGRCRRNNGGCGHICRLKGRKRCSCFGGFKLKVDRRSCEDVDECALNKGNCSHSCVNTEGSYYCRCEAGFRLGGDFASCQDVNECFLRNGHGPCQDQCRNTYGSYVCGCPKTSRLADDGHSCVDIDECAEGLSECSHICINTKGRTYCSCPDGYELGADWKTCIDINECDDETIANTCNVCINKIGSYNCENKLQNDQSGGRPKNTNCRMLKLPRYGKLKCDQEITRVGTVCQLICPKGFKLVGRFIATCGMFGNWLGYSKGYCKRIP